MSTTHPSHTTHPSGDEYSQPTSRATTPDPDAEREAQEFQTGISDNDDDQSENNNNNNNQNWNDDDGNIQGDENGEDEDDSEQENDSFPLSVPEIASLFSTFYRFLATLHFDPSTLKFPPSGGGWPELTPSRVGSWKEPFALEVLRHLPYFHRGGGAPLDYKSELVDYTSMEEGFFDQPDWWEEHMDGYPYTERMGSAFRPRMAFVIAEGHESFGQQWVFDAEHGEIYVEQIRADADGPFEVRVFFLEGIMDKYRRLEMISSPARTTFDTKRVAEREGRIDEEEVIGLKGRFGTDLDLQFLRQVYRDYGWPDAFRREECRAYVDGFMERLEEVRGDSWEGDRIGDGYQGYIMESAARLEREKTAEQA